MTEIKYATTKIWVSTKRLLKKLAAENDMTMVKFLDHMVSEKASLPSRLEIIAIDESGYRSEIDDLYWFEEQGVHKWDGDGHYDKYIFEIYVNGELVCRTGWKR